MPIHHPCTHTPTHHAPPPRCADADADAGTGKPPTLHAFPWLMNSAAIACCSCSRPRFEFRFRGLDGGLSRFGAITVASVVACILLP